MRRKSVEIVTAMLPTLTVRFAIFAVRDVDDNDEEEMESRPPSMDPRLTPPMLPSCQEISIRALVR